MGKDQLIGEKLLTELNTPIIDRYEFIKIGREIFTHSISILIDYYRSSAVGPTSGIKNHTIKILFVRCINDLVTGFHLASHAYVNQFYSVTRPIFESLDLIELFKKDEKFAELWSDDSSRFYKEYSPGKIRKELGRSKFDPEYGLFCQIGSHPTFIGLKSGAYFVKKEEGERSVFIINLGPTDLFVPAMLPLIFSYLLLMMISISIIEYFGKESKSDSRHFLRTIVEEYKEFMEECILKGFASKEIEITPIQDVIDQTDAMIKILDRNINPTKVEI
jgi:hypothetical protein